MNKALAYAKAKHCENYLITHERLAEILTDFANSEQPDLSELEKGIENIIISIADNYAVNEKTKHLTLPAYINGLRNMYLWLREKHYLVKPYLKSEVVDWKKVEYAIHEALIDAYMAESMKEHFKVKVLKSIKSTLHPKPEKQEDKPKCDYCHEKEIFGYDRIGGLDLCKECYKKLVNTQPKKK